MQWQVMRVTSFFFLLYGEGMREKEGLKGGIKTAIFVDIH
jgi:hypothetical protein